MSVDITKLSAHLTPALQSEVKTAYHKESKEPTTAFLLCFFLGLLGAHRFYLGEWGKGLAHLALTLAGVVVLMTGLIIQGSNGLILDLVGAGVLLIGLIWEAIDLSVIDQQVYNRNLAVAERVIAAVTLSDTSPENAAITELASLDRKSAGSAAPTAAALPEGAGIITAAEVADARAMADESGATPGASAHYSSMSRMELSESPEEERKEAEVRASEATVTGEPAASAALADQTEAQGVTQPADGSHDWSVSRTETAHVGPGEASDVVATIATTGADATPVAEEVTGVAATGEAVSPAALGLGALAAGAAGFTVAETVTHRHEESGDRVTDSLEDDRTFTPDAPVPAAPEPVATAAEPAPVVGEPESFLAPDLAAPDAPAATDSAMTQAALDAMDAPTEPNVAPAEMAALAATPFVADATEPATLAPSVADALTAPAATGLGVVAPDVTDGLAAGAAAAPIADIAPMGVPPVHVNLPPGLPSRGPGDSTADATFLLAPEVAFSPQPAAQEYVPPTVTVADATPEDVVPVAAVATPAVQPAAATGPSAGEVAGLAGLGALAGVVGGAAGEAVVHDTAPAAPAAPTMKRIRVTRRLTSGDQVFQDIHLERIVPIDTDSATVERELLAELESLSPEQIAEMVHAKPEEIEVHRRTEGM